MVHPSSAPRARAVLVIDEGLRQATPWLAPIERSFAVVTAACLAGVSLAVAGREVVAVVLVLATDGAQRARTSIDAMRRHRSLEHVAIFVVAPDAARLSAELMGLIGVEVLDPKRAEYDLPLQVGAAASRKAARASRRLVGQAHSSGIRPAVRAPVEPAQRLLERFAQDCGERGQRGLALCERLSARESSTLERQRAANELRSLLDSVRTDAAALQQGELSRLLGLAEQIVSRLTGARGQVVVPRGVVGLLSAVADMRNGPEQLTKFDAELHRLRLEAALERA